MDAGWTVPCRHGVNFVARHSSAECLPLGIRPDFAVIMGERRKKGIAGWNLSEKSDELEQEAGRRRTHQGFEDPELLVGCPPFVPTTFQCLSRATSAAQRGGTRVRPPFAGKREGLCRSASQELRISSCISRDVRVMDSLGRGLACSPTRCDRRARTSVQMGSGR